MRFSFATAETRFARWFFAYFWRLLLVVISSGQWLTLVWIVLLLRDMELPVWLHVLGIAGLYTVNRAVVVRRRVPTPRGSGWAIRAYAAWAFTALFCFVFFVGAAATWGLARGVLGALAVNAGTVGAPVLIENGVDGAFSWFVSFGMGAIGLLFTYGYVFGRRELVVTRLRLPVRSLAPGVPIRIVQISDIHVGQNLRPDELVRFVAQVNALEPDLICITGDIIDSPSADCDRFLPLLAGLHAPQGVCIILGNHDHIAGAARVVAALRRWTTFEILRDQAVTLTVKGSALHVIGLDDRGRDWARGRLSDAALGSLLAAAPAGLPIVLLSHRPDLFAQAASAGVTLMLSGHTHGGQLALPWFGGRRRNLAEFITDFDRGLYERDGSFLYVNSGLGVTAQPIRLFTPREITVIELQAE